jgi:hypothetical protein
MELDFPTTAIFSGFTREELRLLSDFINKEKLNAGKLFWGLRIANALKNCMHDPYQLSSYPFDEDTDFEIFTINMDQLPLYLNDEDPEKAAIAKWRLSLGR